MPSGRSLVSLSLGAFDVSIAADQRVIDEVSDVFVDQIVDRPAFLRVDVSGRPGHEQLTMNGQLWVGEPHHTLIDKLGYMLMRAHLDMAPGSLHLHAGLVDDGSRSVIVAGLVGSGKSTLIAGLVHEGFDFHTDERVTVRPDGHVVPLRKPLALTAGAFDALDALDPTLVERHGRGASYWHLPASAIRPHRTAEASPVAVVLFVEPMPDGGFSDGSGPLLTPVSRPEALSRLLVDLPYGHERRVNDLHDAARAVAGASAFTVASRDAVAVAAELRAALADAGPSVDVTQLWPPGRRGWGHRGPRLADGVGAVRIDEVALATTPQSGDVFELDGPTGSWLELFDGRQTLDELVTAIVAETAMEDAVVREIAEHAVRRLEQAGLLA
jgi:hypothetical protein